MPINNNSLDPVVASLISGGIKRNPSYNPSTKKGREQPEFIQDKNPAAVYDLGAGVAKQSKKVAYDNVDLGLTPEEWDKEVDKGAVVSPYYNSDERYKLKYAKQGLFEKTMNSAIQLFGSEGLLGAAKTVFDIGDRLLHVIKEEDDDDFRPDGILGLGGKIEDAQNYLRDEFEIFQENPDKNFQLSDPGWWLQNVTNVGSSISFYLGGLGIAKTAGLIGKIGIGGKNLANALKAVNLAVTKTGSAIGAIKNPYTAANALGATEDIFATAFLSRTAEGQMEARETYKNVQADMKAKLNAMSDAEYADFVARNKNIPNIEYLSRDEAANILASTAAKDTFADDYAMLFMDFMQIKSLKNMWKGFSSRAATSAIRSAQDGVLNRLAGVAEAETTKGFLSRTGAKILDSVKHFNPIKSIPFNEGVEEFYQGAVQQQSEDKAKFAIDGKHRVRGLGDYIQDASLWEQAFWGVAGGLIFEGGANAFNKAKSKLDAKRKGEDFVSEDRARIAEIQARVEGFNKLVNGLNSLNEGFIPGQYERNEKGDIIYDENNNPIRRKVKTDINGHADASEIEAAKNKLFNEFITEYGIYAAENGNSDLLKAMIKDKRMNQFFDEQLKDSNVTADGFQQRLLDKLDETYNEYNKHYLSTMNSVKDADDKIARFTAKQIIRINNNINDVNDEITRANAAIDAVVPAGETINEDYVNHARGLIATHRLRRLEEERIKLNDAIANGKISKLVYDRELAEINEEARQIGEIAFPSHSDEVFPSIHGILSLDDESFSSAALLREAEQTFYDLRNKGDEYYVPSEDFSAQPQNVQNAYFDRANLDFTKSELEDLMPKNKKGYKRLYDNYYDRLSEEARNKRKEAVVNIREWLKEQDDVDAAFNKLMKDGVDGKFDDELLLLRLGANKTSEYEMLLYAELEEIKRKRKEEEDKANSVTINGIRRPSTITPPSTGKPSGQTAQPATSTTPTTPIEPITPTRTPEEEEAIRALEEQFGGLDLEETLSPEEEAALADDEEVKAADAAAEAFNSLRNYMSNLEEKIPSEEFLNPDSDIINELRNTILPNLLREDKMNESLIEDAVDSALSTMTSLAKRASNKSNSMNTVIDNAEENSNTENSDIVNNAVTKFIKGRMSEEERNAFKEAYDKFVTNIVLDYVNNAGFLIKNGIVRIDGLDFIDYIIKNNKLSATEAKQVIAYLYDYISYTTEINTKDKNEKEIKIVWKRKTELNKLLKSPSEVYAAIIDNRRKIEEIKLDTRMHISAPSRIRTGIASEEEKDRFNNAVYAARTGIPLDIQTNNGGISIGVYSDYDGELVRTEIGFLAVPVRNNEDSAISLKQRDNFIHYVINIENGEAVSTNLTEFMEELLLRKTDKVDEADELFEVIVNYDGDVENIDTSIAGNSLFKKIFENKDIIRFSEDNTENDKIDKTLRELKKYIFEYDDKGTAKDILYLSFVNRMYKFYDNYTNTERLHRGEAYAEYTGADEDVINYGTDKNIADKEVKSKLEGKPVIVFRKGQGIDEYGNTYNNPAGFKNGTMGIVIENKNGTPIVALFKDSNKISANKEFHSAINKELNDIFTKFQKREYDFETVADKLKTLVGNKSHKVGFNLLKGIDIIEKDNIIIISNSNIRGDKGIIAVVYKYTNKDSSIRGTGISYKSKNGRASSIEYNKDIVDAIANEISDTVKFNPSWYTFENKNDEEGKNEYYTVKDGRIHITVGEYSKKFDSFGNFAISMNAFTTNHIGTKTEVKNSLYLSVTGLSRLPVEGEQHVYHIPKTLLEQSVNPNGNTNKEVEVKDLMLAAGFTDEEIEAVTNIKDDSGKELIATSVLYDNKYKGISNAYYSGKDNNVYITPKGAELMSNVRTGRQEVKRLLIHENLHRHFREAGLFNDTASPKTKRIVRDLIETFDRFREAISDENYNQIDNRERKQIIALLDDIESKYRSKDSMFSDEENAEFAEEWIVESLSQKVLAKHLNTLLFDESGSRDDISDINNVTDEKKTFFNRIIESLIKLFNTIGIRIKNHSILARQYYILSQLGGETNETSNEENKEETDTSDEENKDDELRNETINTGEEITLDDDTTNDEDNPFDDLIDFSDEDTRDAVTTYIEEFAPNDKSYTNSMTDLNNRFTKEEQAFIEVLQARQEFIYKCGL